MSLKIQSQIPIKASTASSSLSSSSAHIVRTNQVEMPAQINGTYSYSGNSEILIDINSPSDFIDFQNSFLRFRLTNASLKNNGVEVDDRYLSEGGGHALFRSVSIETQSGVVIQRIDRYNKYYASMSNILHSQEYVNKALHREADSFEPVSQVAGGTPPFPVAGQFAYDHTGGAAEKLITFSSGATSDLMEVGDFLSLSKLNSTDANNGGYFCKITSVPTPTTITVEGLPPVDITATAGQTIVVIKSGTAKAVRNRVCVDAVAASSDAKPEICLSLGLPFLQMTELFPLMLVRGGLRLRIQLERPEHVLCAPTDVVSNGFTADYSIANVYFVAHLLTPDESLAQSYVELYKNAGIAYSFDGVDFNLLTSDSSAWNGSQSYRIQSGARSLNSLMMKIQDVRHESVSAGNAALGLNTYQSDCVAFGTDLGLDEVQIEIGSARFPYSRPLNLRSKSKCEASAQLQKTFGVFGNPAGVMRPNYERFSGERASNDYWETGGFKKDRADRFLLAVSTAKDQLSPFTGVDARLAPVFVNLKGSSAFTTPDGLTTASTAYILTWLTYSSVLQMSSDSGLTVLY